MPPPKELEVVGIEASERHTGIPLKDSNALVRALTAYSMGATQESDVTSQLLLNEIEDRMGRTFRNFAQSSMPSYEPGDIVEQILNEAIPIVNSQGRWQRYYDYGAMGSTFLHTEVGIDRLPDFDDGYLLKLRTLRGSGGQDRAEKDLAKFLEVDRGLEYKGVQIQLKPDGTYCDIDFDKVAGRLQSLCADLHSTADVNYPLTGAQMLNTIASRNLNHGWSFRLGIQDGVGIAVSVDGTYKRENWQVEGGHLRAPLEEGFERQGVLLTPSISIGIQRSEQNRWLGIPAVTHEMKDTMDQLSNRVVAAFQPVTQ